MEQKGPSDGTSNVLRCRQELDATTKKINKLAESKSKHQRHVNSSSSSKNRSNLSHPTIPPPPPPEKHLKSINYTLRQDNIGEMSPRAPPIQQEVSAMSNNMAFIKIGQKESQKDIKSISLPIQPHQRHLSNSQYVITSSSSSNVKAPSFGFEGISKADYKHSISKSSSLKDDEGRLANNESSEMLLSGSVCIFLYKIVSEICKKYDVICRKKIINVLLCSMHIHEMSVSYQFVTCHRFF